MRARTLVASMGTIRSADSSRADRALGGELGAHEVDAVLTPEQLAVDDEGRHGEHTLLLGLLLMALQLRRALALGKGVEARRIDARVGQQAHDRGAVLVIELALEEARIGQIDQGP